jgi:hypothetical protein
LLVVERAELTEPATVGEKCDQDVDNEPDDAEATATNSDSTWADTTSSGVCYLSGVKWSVSPKAHSAFSCLVLCLGNAPSGPGRAAFNEEAYRPRRGRRRTRHARVQRS